jgi:hypothetical protein
MQHSLKKQPIPDKIKTRGLPNQKKIWSSDMLHSAGPKFAVEFLSEFETEIENILG